MKQQRTFEQIAADVRSAKAGDMDAMNRILADVQDMVYYNCLKMLRTPQAAEDATQEILIRVYQKIGTLTDPLAYIGWVKRLTANHCKNCLSKVNKEFLLSETEDGEDPFASFEELDEQRVPDTHGPRRLVPLGHTVRRVEHPARGDQGNANERR